MSFVGICNVGISMAMSAVEFSKAAMSCVANYPFLGPKIGVASPRAMHCIGVALVHYDKPVEMIKMIVLVTFKSTRRCSQFLPEH